MQASLRAAIRATWRTNQMSGTKMPLRGIKLRRLATAPGPVHSRNMFESIRVAALSLNPGLIDFDETNVDQESCDAWREARYLMCFVTGRPLSEVMVHGIKLHLTEEQQKVLSFIHGLHPCH